MPLTMLDVTNCSIKGDITFLENMSSTMLELKLSRSVISGDIISLANFSSLNTLELAKLPKVFTVYSSHIHHIYQCLLIY